MPRHIQAIAKALDRMDAGEIDRLLITMPPRHGKSETITVRLPLRFLQQHPQDNVLVTGYNTQFARKFGRKTRNLADAAGILSDDKTASDEWATAGGGLYMARGVGSPPTGTGFGLIVIDDPVKSREEAESETYRNKVWDWYTDDIYTRLEPGGKLIIVMTRWHEDDLAGRAILSEPFEILKLPAIAGEDDQLGRKPSEALWPNRYPVEAFERIKRTQGDYAFEALYQCNPTPREGSFFKVANLKVIPRSEIPAGLAWTESWDVAATENDGDWTAGVDMAKDAEGRYFVDPIRFRHEPSARNREMLNRARIANPRKITVPQDPGAAGKESAQSFIRLFAGFRIIARLQSGDKFTRAEPFSAQVNAGNVYVIESAWTRDYIEELRQAPMGKHDDFIDASSDAFNEIEGGIKAPTWELY